MDQHGGNPLPEPTLDTIRRTGVALKGPITTPVGSGFRSVNVDLRKALDLYAQCARARTTQACGRASTTSTWSSSARTPRTSTPASSSRRAPRDADGADRLDRAARRQAAPPRRGHLDQADLDLRNAPDRPVRLRLRAPQRPPQGHGRPQGEHHEVHRRALPARRPRGRRGELRHRVRGPDRRQHVHAARAEAGGVRRAGAAEPLRRHRLRPGRRAGRRAGRGARARTSARTVAVFEATHGSAPKYKGQNKVNPIGDDALGDADAPPPRRERRGRPAGGGDRAT